MKKILFISFHVFLVTLFFSLNSCSKDEDSVETQTVSYNAPAHALCNVFSGAEEYSDTYTITIADIQQAFATAGVTYDVSKVQTAKLTSIKATVTDGSSLYFDDISSIDVYVKVEGASGNGTLVAHLDNIELGISNKSLVVNGAEIKSYLASDAVLTVKVTSKTTTYVCINLTQAVIQAEVKE